MSKLVATHVSLCLAGLVIAIYSIHVESMLIDLPGYTPACDISSWKMSCSKVFKSKYAKPFSHWGIVKRHSVFDLSLPQLAILYFIPVLSFPFLRSKFYITRRLFQYLSYASIVFNAYLAYILKFILREICIVCVSNYIVVLGLLLTINLLAGEKVSDEEAKKKLD